ncbi:helix-turn-helix transcriptional regulator [Mesorhizobium sp. M8A.F.Ca.ET.021.01.1.1]|uniref:ArsR/SmtB family transcription factor n=1 Tax=Mesorhizobium sp. M8A.F.Ca.ET.021.01.1.1 TaxID=2496757 RepID=UPI000FCCD029|nr:helix-turn-helix transcriptional regulator [Mesorhizobium sp. M8A.F.Ca.ET.021.01.1.1]RUW56999.1 transcriptional regulator [Mesorhizobium sp. M8A.F.Ca.ET.021.01.1.1]
MDARVIKALACESRLKILDFLNWPELYFPDVPNARKTGLTNKLICGRLGVTQESVSLHMGWLTEAKLVSATKVGTRVFYTRNEPGIDEAVTSLCELLQRGTDARPSIGV